MNRLWIQIVVCFLMVFLNTTNGSAQQSHERQLVQSIAEEKNPKKRFKRIMALGEFYKEQNLYRADSMRSIIMRESRNFDDSVRFSALFYNAEIHRLHGNQDEYFKTILQCQPFLNKLKDDDVQFHVYRHLGYYHSSMQEFETAQFYLKIALKKAQKKRDLGKQSEAYSFIALNFMTWNKKDSSLYFSDRAISTGRRSGDKIILAKAFNVKAQIYDFYGQVELSVAKNFVSLRLAEEVRNLVLMAQYNREMGQSQKAILNLESADKYFKKSLEYAKQVYDRRQIALALTNLATVQLERDQYDKAINSANRAIQYLTDLGDYNGLGETHNILGMVYNEQKLYGKASSSFNQALVFYESTSNKEKIAGVYHNVGSVFKAQQKYGKALEYLDRSIDIREQFGSKTQIYKTYRVIADVYKDINDVDKSLHYMELYLDYLDSNTTLQAAAKIAELNESYQADQRERLITSQQDSIERQRQQRELATAKLESSQLRNNFQMYIIIAFLIIIVMAGLIIFYRWNQTKIKQQQREAEMSQTLLRTQMNPHFVFNAMSVIQSYIFENDTVNSSKFLVNFSRLMRLILENSPKEFIPIETEMEILQKYLEMQKLRFQDRFEFNIHSDEALFGEQAIIPPMITQPFIENAIEHGQLHTIEGGFINVSFTKENEMLHISIIDNGIGRKGSRANKKSSAHKSMAMKITRERIENLNKKYKTDGSLLVEDYNKELETGTKVLISLPYTTDAARSN